MFLSERLKLESKKGLGPFSSFILPKTKSTDRKHVLVSLTSDSKNLPPTYLKHTICDGTLVKGLGQPIYVSLRTEIHTTKCFLFNIDSLTVKRSTSPVSDDDRLLPTFLSHHSSIPVRLTRKNGGEFSLYLVYQHSSESPLQHLGSSDTCKVHWQRNNPWCIANPTSQRGRCASDAIFLCLRNMKHWEWVTSRHSGGIAPNPCPISTTRELIICFTQLSSSWNIENK